MIDELCRVLSPAAASSWGLLTTPDGNGFTSRRSTKGSCRALANGHIRVTQERSCSASSKHKGLTHEATRYIARAELIMAFRPGCMPQLQSHGAVDARRAWQSCPVPRPGHRSSAEAHLAVAIDFASPRALAGRGG